MRKADTAFAKELKRRIDKRMEPYWSDRWKKWMIVSHFLPNGARCERPVKGITEYDPILGRHFVVNKVLEENGKPLELTPRVIRGLEILKQGKEVRLDRALRKADQEELERSRRHDREAELGKKEFTKWVHRLDTSKTFS